MFKMEIGECEFISGFMTERDRVGSPITFSEIFSQMKGRFGKRVNLIEVIEIRKELGLSLYFCHHTGTS